MKIQTNDSWLIWETEEIKVNIGTKSRCLDFLLIYDRASKFILVGKACISEDNRTLENQLVWLLENYGLPNQIQYCLNSYQFSSTLVHTLGECLKIVIQEKRVWTPDEIGEVETRWETLKRVFEYVVFRDYESFEGFVMQIVDDWNAGLFFGDVQRNPRRIFQNQMKEHVFMEREALNACFY